jgi:hypothetical protein
MFHGVWLEKVDAGQGMHLIVGSVWYHPYGSAHRFLSHSGDLFWLLWGDSWASIDDRMVAFDLVARNSSSIESLDPEASAAVVTFPDNDKPPKLCEYGLAIPPINIPHIGRLDFRLRGKGAVSGNPIPSGFAPKYFEDDSLAEKPISWLSYEEVSIKGFLCPFSATNQLCLRRSRSLRRPLRASIRKSGTLAAGGLLFWRIRRG